MHHRSGRRRAAAFLAATLLNGGLVVAAATPAAAATTIRVPFDEPTISAALAVAVDGDTIDVHTGYYPEAPNFQGKDVAVVVNTFGGTSASIDPPGTSHIAIGPGGRLEGFLIYDGNAQQGGAIKVNGKGSVIKGNLIVDNDEGGSGSGGAAIYGKSASPVIEANMFVRNACGGDTQPSAGVLTFVGPSAPVIVNNAFIDNTCGAAVSLRSIPSGKQPVITNNTIIGGPTGIQLDGGNADDQVIRNNIIHETTVGIDVDTITPPTVPPTIEHNLMGDNGQDYRGLPDPTGSNGNITGDPLFIHRDGHDVRPQESSPAVDAGTATGAPATDRYGIARPIDGADADLDPEFDIGAHERTGGEPPPPPPPPTSGMLDPAWADDGVSLFPSRYSIALGPTGDGGTFVGSYKVTDGDGPMRVSKFEATGDPASGWGTAGYVIRAFEPGGAGVSFPTHVVPVGLRVTVVGEHYRDTARLGVARLRSDGSYDPAFSSDGRALYKVFPTEHDVVSAFRAEVLTGDKIGIAVVAFDADSHGDLQFTAQAMLKLNANGTQDTTFSGDGVAVIPNSWSDVRWRANGSSFVGVQGATTHQVRKLLPSGQLDLSFSGDGIASAACGTHRGANMGIDLSGRPLLQCVKDTSPSTTLAMYRFTTTGAFDTTYSGDGKTSWVIPNSSELRAHFDATGKPWVAAGGPSPTGWLRLYTLDASGNPDAAFNDDGESSFELPFPVDLNGIERSGSRLFVTNFKGNVNVAMIAVKI